MKVLYTTDLHGVELRYNHICEIAKNNKVDMIINGGDMLPTVVSPYLQYDFITGFLDLHFSMLNDLGIYYLCLLGNDDFKAIDNIFDDICNKYEYIVNIAQRSFELRGYEFIGFNLVVDYPFRLKDRCRMDTKDYVFGKQLGNALLSTRDGFEEITDWIKYANSLPTIENELVGLVKPRYMMNTIYVIHMPPYGIGLDECYRGRCGSEAIYKFLEVAQPKISLHGHIHESPDVSSKWSSKIDNVVCIQPGQSTFNNKLVYVLIDLDSMDFRRYVG